MAETKPYQGWMKLKKRGGNGPMSLGAERALFITNAVPVNPVNLAYPPGINASAYPSVRVRNMLTPQFSLTACLKPFVSGTGWCDDALLNSLIGDVYTDEGVSPFAYNQTDRFALAIRDDRPDGYGGFGDGLRIWEWARCSTLTLSQDSSGGPLMVEMGFASRWGDNEASQFYGTTNSESGEVYPSAPSFSAPTAAVNAGELTNPSQVAFNGTLQCVRRWTLTMMRGQTYEPPCFDRTLYPRDISTKMFSGALTLHMNPISEVMVVGDGIVRIQVNPSLAQGFYIDCALSMDSALLTHEVQAGNLVLSYSLADMTTGGKPVAIVSND